MVCLENDFLKVWVKPKGAELKSLVHKESGIEHIWDANPYYWGKSSPVLFPIVGSLKNDSYTFENKSYSLSRHGFARDMVFEIEEKKPKTVVFLLRANADTLKVYPFYFELRLIYFLVDSELQLTYQLSNVGDKPMYFSLGGHPAFMVPYEGAGKYEEYSLEFNQDTSFEKWLLDKNGLLNGEAELVKLEDGKLNLTKELFYKDALVIKGLKSDQVTIRGKEGYQSLRFKFQDFSFFGIWAAKNAPFVSLEPWCGLADSVDHNQELTEKEGINKLEAGAEFTRSWSVEVV